MAIDFPFPTIGSCSIVSAAFDILNCMDWKIYISLTSLPWTVHYNHDGHQFHSNPYYRQLQQIETHLLPKFFNTIQSNFFFRMHTKINSISKKNCRFYTLSGCIGSALVWYSEGRTIEALSVQ